jgi:predicted nucleic acid-binding protein
MQIIYLDNCCFNRPYDNQTQERIYLESLAKLYIQQLIIDEKIAFVWSFILEYENSKNPYEIRRNAIRKFSHRSARFVGIAEEITANANEIAKTGIKEKDSIHLACALFANCDYLITTDDRLLKFQTDRIKVVDPIQFIKEMEGLL